MDILDGLLLASTGASSYFENAGTITQFGTNTFTLSGSVLLNNTGVVDVQAGTFLLSGGGTNTGSIFIRSNAYANLNANMSHPVGSYLGEGRGNPIHKRHSHVARQLPTIRLAQLPRWCGYCEQRDPSQRYSTGDQ